MKKTKKKKTNFLQEVKMIFGTHGKKFLPICVERDSWTKKKRLATKNTKKEPKKNKFKSQ